MQSDMDPPGKLPSSLSPIDQAEAKLIDIVDSVVNESSNGGGFAGLVDDLATIMTNDVPILEGKGGYGLIQSPNEPASDVMAQDVAMLNTMLQSMSSAQQNDIYNHLTSNDAVVDLAGIVSGMGVDVDDDAMTLYTFMNMSSDQQRAVMENANVIDFSSIESSVQGVSDGSIVVSGPEGTIFTIPGDTIEGIAAGDYHIYEDHSSGLDNDYRVNGEAEITLTSDQQAELNALNPIGYSTKSDTTLGSVVELDTAILQHTILDAEAEGVLSAAQNTAAEASYLASFAGKKGKDLFFEGELH